MPSIGVDMGDIPDLTSDSDDDEEDDKPYVGEDALEDRDCVGAVQSWVSHIYY
jgi:hypothetical protein